MVFHVAIGISASKTPKNGYIEEPCIEAGMVQSLLVLFWGALLNLIPPIAEGICQRHLSKTICQQHLPTHMSNRGPLPPWMQKNGHESKGLNDDHLPARGVFGRPKVQGTIKVLHGRSSDLFGGKVRHNVLRRY
jgi:hypothetical protein